MTNCKLLRQLAKGMASSLSVPPAPAHSPANLVARTPPKWFYRPRSLEDRVRAILARRP